MIEVEFCGVKNLSAISHKVNKWIFKYIIIKIIITIIFIYWNSFTLKKFVKYGENEIFDILINF